MRYTQEDMRLAARLCLARLELNAIFDHPERDLLEIPRIDQLRAVLAEIAGLDKTRIMRVLVAETDIAASVCMCAKGNWLEKSRALLASLSDSNITRS